MAREQLNVTVVIFNNRAYGILGCRACPASACQRGGDEAQGPCSSLGDPDLDFVKLGAGLGVASRRVDTAEQLTDALDQAIADPGPHLIEAVIPRRRGRMAAAGVDAARP